VLKTIYNRAEIELPSMDNPDNKIDTIERAINDYAYLIRSAIRKTSPQISASDMDDIEQEVKIKIWKQILNSEKKILNLGSYIWKVTYTTTCRVMKKLTTERNLAIGHYNGAHNFEEKIVRSKDSLPDSQLEKKELMIIVKECVDALMESRRAVLKLHLMGMDHREISQFFGWSEGKVRNLISRGLEDLRNSLKERGF
jgi:RNA polymerase sigma factor (sigma-70 family)